MYTSTAVTDELLALSDELASLGGGDTSIGECAVYFRPRPANPGEGVCVSTESRGRTRGPHVHSCQKRQIPWRFGV